MDLGKENRMERHFEKDMNVLKERLLWMGSLAERAVHQAVHSVLESDEALAKRVLEEEARLIRAQEHPPPATVMVAQPARRSRFRSFAGPDGTSS